MKLNLELVRELLIYIEENGDGKQGVYGIRINGYTNNEIMYHTSLLKVLKNQDYFPNTLAEYRKMRYNNVKEHKELLNTYDNKLEYQNFMKTFKRHQVPKEYLPKDFEEFNNIKKNILEDNQMSILKYEELKFRNKILKEK